VKTENQLLVTAHPEFMQAALTELEQLDKHLIILEEITTEITLCTTDDLSVLIRQVLKARPLFVRHLAPVQTIVELSNDERDIARIATALAALPGMTLLERGTRFAVQSRLARTDKAYGERSYSSGHLNKTLAEVFAEETGATEDIKKPRIVISILCTMQKGYLGISPVEENLSDWPGGARQFAHVPEQISRAEFKLLEALDVFGLSLPTSGCALDLGAAPGGWTRLLLEAGLHVVAVDPAHLDSRLAKRAHLEHYRGYAEHYLEEAVKAHRQFELIVNDMRMDARDAARLLARASSCLHQDGFVISVLKLPHATPTIDPLAMLKTALSILKERYRTVQARQLFHNRQEVTVVTAHPLPLRR
jgi:23S rRNA (cytidine2498-2'-O)-methyltransferase